MKNGMECVLFHFFGGWLRIYKNLLLVFNKIPKKGKGKINTGAEITEVEVQCKN
jgi:hypothetical protein